MSSMESIAISEQLTMEDQIERKKVLEQLQEIEKAGPSAKATPKGHAALLTGLNTLAGEALKGGSKTAVHSDATGSTDATDVEATDASDDTSGGFGSSKGDSGGGDVSNDDSSDDYYIPDPLTASIMAGVVGLVSKSELTKQTALMQEQLSKASTQTAKNGTDWMNNFYKYGQNTTSGDSMGSYDKGRPHTPGDKSSIYFKIEDNHWKMSLSGKDGTYKDLGALTGTVGGGAGIPSNDLIAEAFPGYTVDDSDKEAIQKLMTTHSGSCSNGDGKAFNFDMINNNDNEGGGSGLAAAASGDMQTLMTQWSYVQQTVNSYNQTIQTTANLPAAMQQNTSSSINNGDQSRQSVQSALDSTANLIVGWSNT